MIWFQLSVPSIQRYLQWKKGFHCLLGKFLNKMNEKQSSLLWFTCLIWFHLSSKFSHVERKSIVPSLCHYNAISCSNLSKKKIICKPNQCDFISKTITTTVQSRAGDSSCEQPVVSRDERMSRQQNIWVFRRKGQDLSLLFFPLVFHFLAKVTTTCVI